MAEKFVTHEYIEIFYSEIQNSVTKNMTECKQVWIEEDLWDTM